ELAKQMIRLAGLEEGKDISIVYSGLRPGEKLFEELLAPAELTIPTYHKKIRIAKVRHYKYEEARESIEALLEVNKLQQNKETVKKMKAILPEFVSNNSVYEEMDRAG